jgi:hypothetical protein
MTVYRVDLLTNEPDPVFEWLDATIPRPFIIRSVAFKTLKGWHFKCVFKRPEDAEAFHQRWYPKAEDHLASSFGSRDA